jgi:predicted RNase H-like nuclease (RuvC/YqgF family)
LNWEQLGLLVGVLSPLVGVPLGVIALYLRAIREHQTTTTSEMARRIETMERSINDLLRATADFEREYATKEEWVRESMLARQRLEHLTEMTTRIEAELDGGKGLAAELSRATTAMVEVVKQLARGAGEAVAEVRSER